MYNQTLAGFIDHKAVIPNRLDIPNRQAFNSGAFGQPNDAEIWGCKSGVVATQLVLLEALAKNMSETVPEGHPDWKNRIDSLNVALQKAYTEAFGLCNAVDPAVVPPQK